MRQKKFAGTNMKEVILSLDSDSILLHKLSYAEMPSYQFVEVIYERQ